MMKKAIISCVLLAAPLAMFAQLKVNTDGTTCDHGVGSTDHFLR